MNCRICHTALIFLFATDLDRNIGANNIVSSLPIKSIFLSYSWIFNFDLWIDIVCRTWLHNGIQFILYRSKIRKRNSSKLYLFWWLFLYRSKTFPKQYYLYIHHFYNDHMLIYYSHDQIFSFWMWDKQIRYIFGKIIEFFKYIQYYFLLQFHALLVINFQV